jgi:heat shock protein HtpX
MGLGRRVLLATVGLVSLAVSLAVAVVGYELLVALWAQRPSPAVAAGVVVQTAFVERMDVTPPELLVARLPLPNTFAVGYRRGAIAVDRRLLAHELAHLETHPSMDDRVERLQAMATGRRVSP